VMNANRYAKLRITILGMARQGQALARFFLAAGAQVTLSDLRSDQSLTDACLGLQTYAHEHGAPAPAFVLGDHPLALLDRTDLLCLSGGVSPALPIVQEAVRRGIPLTNDGALTLELCPVPIIGITGSAGKTTTTTLVNLMLENAGFTVHTGGNIGNPLIDHLEAFGPGDKAVMELSSFQLELFTHSPAIAAILNITPNHLDRHPSMSHYAAAKANILRHQTAGDTCLLNADDGYTGPWLSEGRCRIPEGEGQPAVYFPLRAARLGFSLNAEIPAGAFLAGDVLVWRRPGLPDAEICRREDIRLRGLHNVANILAACCLAGAAGAGVKAMASVATSFAGVEHRLEIVRERTGILWVNDSIATTPERAIAALRSFSQPVVLLAGGRDKHLPWDQFAAITRKQARHVVLFGEAAELIQNALYAQNSTPDARVPITRCADLPAAVAAAENVARPGDVVLLSPGGTSFDAYQDFAARGQHFRALVEALP
jgi:UDP-N-acetylmuramoylalanine--D-glutamate ligase